MIPGTSQFLYSNKRTVRHKYFNAAIMKGVSIKITFSLLEPERFCSINHSRECCPLSLSHVFKIRWEDVYLIAMSSPFQVFVQSKVKEYRGGTSQIRMALRWVSPGSSYQKTLRSAPIRGCR